MILKLNIKLEIGEYVLIEPNLLLYIKSFEIWNERECRACFENVVLETNGKDLVASEELRFMIGEINDQGYYFTFGELNIDYSTLINHLTDSHKLCFSNSTLSKINKIVLN